MKVISLLFSPETIENFDFQKLSTDIEMLRKDFNNIQVLIFPQTLETLKIDYRSEILEIFRKNEILVVYVKSFNEIYSYATFILKQN